MALSELDIQQILETMKANSQDASQLEEATSMDEVDTLPVVADGKWRKLPLSLLQQAVESEISLDGKVDKEDGKGLSTNDYTTAEKEKLADLTDNSLLIHHDTDDVTAISLKGGTVTEGNYTSTNKATGQYAVAIGLNNTASGTSSFCSGESGTASGKNSHTEGYSTIASGVGSHTEGRGTTASASYSHAEGYSTSAFGYGSHAEGDSTSASGYGSHAEGQGTAASGYCSHTEGRGTKTTNHYEHAEGQYNESTLSDDESKATRFSIGCGTSNTARKNAVEVKQNGDVYILGISTPIATLLADMQTTIASLESRIQALEGK